MTWGLALLPIALQVVVSIQQMGVGRLSTSDKLSGLLKKMSSNDVALLEPCAFFLDLMKTGRREGYLMACLRIHVPQRQRPEGFAD